MEMIKQNVTCVKEINALWPFVIRFCITKLFTMFKYTLVAQYNLKKQWANSGILKYRSQSTRSFSLSSFRDTRHLSFSNGWKPEKCVRHQPGLQESYCGPYVLDGFRFASSFRFIVELFLFFFIHLLLMKCLGGFFYYRTLNVFSSSLTVFESQT